MSYDLRFTIFVFTIFFSTTAFSQNNRELQLEQSSQEETSNQQSTINNQQSDSALTYHKVMLIPYDPLFYLSDAEQEIAEQTKEPSEKIQASFRKTIDISIQRYISRFRPCISMLNDADSLPSLNQSLQLVYSKAGYRYDKPMPIPYKPEKLDSLKEKKRGNKNEVLDSRIATQYISIPADAQYMNAVITKPSLLSDLYDQYGTDVFVFVNQMEIKTNYSSCLDIANKIYKREMMLHFSVYDKNGKQLAGAFSKSFFPSDSNNAYDIMRNCFPELAKVVAVCTP